MGGYLVRRLLQAVPLLVGISFAAFVLMRLAPGGPMAVYAQNPNLSEADMRRIEHILGLDQPIHIQYLKWAAGMATGNMGYSYRTGLPVGEVILERLPATLQLMGLAYLIAVTLFEKRVRSLRDPKYSSVPSVRHSSYTTHRLP